MAISEGWYETIRCVVGARSGTPVSHRDHLRPDDPGRASRRRRRCLHRASLSSGKVRYLRPGNVVNGGVGHRLKPRFLHEPVAGNGVGRLPGFDIASLSAHPGTVPATPADLRWCASYTGGRAGGGCDDRYFKVRTKLVLDNRLRRSKKSRLAWRMPRLRRTQTTIRSW
jgi:hypothetical protein